MGIGGHGLFAQAGKPSTDSKTLVGLSASASNSLFAPSSMPAPLARDYISSSSATTRALSMVGRMGEAGTEKQTLFFDKSMTYLNRAMMGPPSTCSTFPAETTPQMGPPGEFSRPTIYSYPQYHCLESYTSSSAMLTSPQAPGSTWATISAQMITRSPSTTRTDTGRNNCGSSAPHGLTDGSRFISSTPIAVTHHNVPARPYDSRLTPNPSPLRPHCLARDRLRLWCPQVPRSRLDHTGSLVNISDNDIDCIITVLAHSHAPNTKETYGSGLLVFHVFCDAWNIPEEQRCPASPVLILAFIAGCSGLYSGKSLENYFYAIRAWHLLHGQPWLANHDQCALALAGGKRLAPPTSKRPKRAPFTVDLLIAIRSTLDLTSPLHAAVYACLTTSFCYK
ncbi:uncharacterized protein F5147DRAFT_773900 [Suillus discolor]|uniref:Uncharacterized protein n=1 Tax=Suillus discolor TaxID=1912936 RepID=A0A9P7F5F7_9AGAM|nr:uncharacterized protein F5147DRAFT_773900 [Suillus discolor]KAG2107916.1 hypothetical protein F5147DRAFT_773900 [Suillus discolor]